VECRGSLLEKEKPDVMLLSVIRRIFIDWRTGDKVDMRRRSKGSGMGAEVRRAEWGEKGRSQLD
jgi:hypothetical protein